MINCSYTEDCITRITPTNHSLSKELNIMIFVRYDTKNFFSYFVSQCSGFDFAANVVSDPIKMSATRIVVINERFFIGNAVTGAQQSNIF